MVTLQQVISNPLFPFFSIIIGGVISWYCSRRYYIKATKDLEDAGKELKVEAAKLRLHTQLILSFLENKAHDISIKRNDSGEPIGLIVNLSATLKGTGELKVKHAS